MPKRVLPLTTLQIVNAKQKNKQYKLSDGGGLYLLVTPSGGKLWRLKYRFGGHEKKLAIGAFPEISLNDARQDREKAKALLAEDIDPGAVKKEQQATLVQEQETFEAVSREWHGQKLSRSIESRCRNNPDPIIHKLISASAQILKTS